MVLEEADEDDETEKETIKKLKQMQSQSLSDACICCDGTKSSDDFTYVVIGRDQNSLSGPIWRTALE